MYIFNQRFKLLSLDNHYGEVLHHLFIYLFISWSNSMAALLPCDHFTALCTSKGDITASAIWYLWRFILDCFYIGMPLWALHAASVVSPIAFISALFAATCSQPTIQR